MKEELYVIKDGTRLQLDLNSPSGITLNYVSNLFNDLSKINSSYTYTFNLPLTTNNRLALDLVDDIRHDSYASKKKINAEYRQNGVALFTKCYLYITAVKDGNISCCFTWGVLEGFSEMQKHDLPLNELEGDDYEWHSNYDFSHEKDDIVYIDGKFDEYTNENLNKDIAKPYYVAGADCDENMGISFSYKDGALSDFDPSIRPGVSFSEVAPIYRDPEHALTGVPYTDKFSSYPSSDDTVIPIPAPVVKVQKIVDKISERFDADFALGGGFYEKLYMPLVSTNKSDGLLEQVCIWTDFPRAANIYFGAAKESGENAMPVFISYDSISATDVHVTNIKGSTEGVELFKIRLEDEPYSPNVPSDIAPYGALIGSKDRRRFKLVLDGYVNLPYLGEGMTFEVRYFDKDKYSEPLLSVEPEWRPGTAGSRYRCEFRKSKGYENAETDYITPEALVCFAISVKDMDISELQEKIPYGSIDLSHLRIYVKRAAGDVEYYANVYKNLPDISCMEFVKSLYYVIGGFPYVDYNGSVSIKYYSDIKKNISTGNTLNWSNKILIRKDSKDDINFAGETVSSLAQTNYYLMKNDSVNDFGAEEQYKYGEDRYVHSYAKVLINNDTLPEQSTIIQMPFSGRFKANKEDIDWFTGETTDLWKSSHRRLTGGEDASPMIGTLYLHESWRIDEERIPEYNDPYEPDRPSGESVIQEIKRGKKITGFKVWQFPNDLLTDSRYNALCAVLNKPYEVIEYMDLNEIDLMWFDYSIPIYLDKYNSYFMVSKIERTSDGISKVNLMRIDTSVLDLSATDETSSDPEFILKGETSQRTYSVWQSSISGASVSDYINGVLKNGHTTVYSDVRDNTVDSGLWGYLTDLDVYAFYGGEQVAPDTIQYRYLRNGVEETNLENRIPFTPGLTLSCEITATYKRKTAVWRRSVKVEDTILRPDVETLWALYCNRPYTRLLIEQGDTVKASELGLAYVEPYISSRVYGAIERRTEVVIDGEVVTRNDAKDDEYGWIMPRKDCDITLNVRRAIAPFDVIDNISFQYVYDIDEYEQREISVAEAVYNSPHLDSDNETL